MRKLRWAMDGGGFWELDLETPTTMEGTARAVPGHPFPLSLSRGSRLSRPKQLDFMHCFMSSPLVPSYHPLRGLALNHAHSFPLHHNLTAFLVERLHLRKVADALRADTGPKGLSWIRDFGGRLLDACTFGIAVEAIATQGSSLMIETYRDDDNKVDRTKAVLSHKFAHHDLTVEAACPGLFVDNHGTYWDVPSSVSVDLASHASDSGLSYHVCMQNISGQGNAISSEKNDKMPTALQPGLSAKAAFSFKKNVDFWRKKDGKQKLVQPYDAFLSDPHFSASSIVGSAVAARFGEKPLEDCFEQVNVVNLHSLGSAASISADIFASIAFTAQHGNFQRLMFDLTRLSTRFEFPSGSALVRGAANVLHDLSHNRSLRKVDVDAVSPKMTVSFQQQLVGPVSFRVESRLGLDIKNNGGHYIQVDDTIFALEYAMQVLGSARATAWYSQKNQEAMVELRFFES